MVTVQSEFQPATRTNYDHRFFSGMAALILVSVFVGFAPTFFLRGIVRIPALQRDFMSVAHPLPLIVVAHGIVFSSWILLLIAQTSLVAAHRMRLHRRLGLAGFGLACLVVLAGVAVSSEAIARLFPPADPRIAFFLAATLFEILEFALLACFGYFQRRNPPAHKRLMLLATICLLPQAFFRWPIWPGHDLRASTIGCWVLLVLIACYDLRALQKIHLTTLGGAAAITVTSLIVASPLVANAFIHNSLWFHFALRMQALGRHLL
jgi:hypothetical protein